MITDYHRPKTIQEALTLLARKEPRTLPLAGGTALNQPSQDAFAVVDLQALGLDGMEHKGNSLVLGAMLTLQTLLEFEGISAALAAAIQHEATHNLRNIATVAGTLVAADGRSPFATALLAMDAHLRVVPGEETISLGNILPQPGQFLTGKIITQVFLPANIRLAYEYVARTSADLPLVCVALAQWSSGRTRLALGGYGACPVLGLDGPEPGGAELTASNAFAQAQDEWASAAYRSEVAAVLTRRCLDQLSA
jgi:CO/xanthine dehydrogenase FAD-binding subunit